MRPAHPALFTAWRVSPLPARIGKVQIMAGSRFSEMMHLVQAQTEALEKQIFGGFTDEEMAEFEERQERIHQLQSSHEFLHSSYRVKGAA
jgi:hypothetical protein